MFFLIKTKNNEPCRYVTDKLEEMEKEEKYKGRRKCKIKQCLTVAGAVKEIIHCRTSLLTLGTWIYTFSTHTHTYGTQMHTDTHAQSTTTNHNNNINGASVH